MHEQQLIGSIIAVLGGLAGYHHHWLLEQTPKGRRLVGWVGLDRARWVFGTVVLAGRPFRPIGGWQRLG